MTNKNSTPRKTLSLPRQTVLKALYNTWGDPLGILPDGSRFAMSPAGNWLANGVTERILAPTLSAEIIDSDRLTTVHQELTEAIRDLTLLVGTVEALLQGTPVPAPVKTVTIEVAGGVAYDTGVPIGVKVDIVDHDNEDDN